MSNIRVDRSLVTEGYPTEDGLHFLWSDHQGWPVLDVVHVQVTDGIVTWWRGQVGRAKPFHQSNDDFCPTRTEGVLAALRRVDKETRP